jgi:RHS repeat-associated protein
MYGPCGTRIEQINNSTGTVLYLHHDQQDSTRLLTGSTGKVEGKCSYSPYGVPTCEGTSTTPLGYDAQYTSTDTGLIYMRARVYDPATAQFLTGDPLAALTGEPYAYANDNPVNEADPTGLGVFSELEELGEEVGNGVAGFGDKLTFGLTKKVREAIGDENVDTCSAGYQAGGYAGLATALVIPGEDDAEFGDLTLEEREAIQDAVDRSGRPLEVVGSAARGERGPGSDIDYTAPASSYPYLQPYERDLPGIDNHGILSGAGDPNEGPSIRFEPEGEW